MPPDVDPAAGAFDLLPAPAAVLDAHGHIIRMNRAWAEAIGSLPQWSQLAGLGCSVDGLCAAAHADDPQTGAQVHAAVQAVLAGRQTQALLVCPIGFPDPGVRAEMVFRRLPDGGAVMLMRDRTARDAAEREARHHADLIEQVLGNFEAVLFLFDRDLQRNVYVSPSYERVWGRPLDEVLGDDPFGWVRAVHPDDLPEVRARVGAGPSAEPWELEWRVVRPDETTRWIRTRTFPVHDDTGRAYRMAGVAIDITAERARAQSLEQGQRFEALGRLAGGVAHDFNNLLTVLLGHLDGLETVAPDDSEAARSLRLVQDTVARAGGLTRQLLAVASRQVVEPRRVDVGGALLGMDGLLRRAIGEDIEVVTVAETDGWPVTIDPSQFEQVLLNLVVNARDAMPDGGTLRCTASCCPVPGTLGVPISVPDGEWVRIDVEDTGSGIAPEALPHVFEPFFTTRGPQGTGLGLATTYGIVQQAGGHIHITSQPDEGTEVSVFLPRAPGSPDTDRIRRRATPRTGTETVLVVEDEPLVLGVMEEALRRAGYRVLTARTGSEALHVAETADRRIDLLVSDVVMPHMGGPELAERMRAADPDLRVLLVSGYADDPQLHGSKARRLSFLAKPFTRPAFTARVRELLDGDPART